MKLKTYKVSFLNIILMLLYISSAAQSKIDTAKNKKTQYEIRRIGQFSYADKSSKTFRKLLGKIVLGADSRNFKLIKPTAVTALNPERLFVIDRGLNALAVINNKKIVTAEPIRGMKYQFNSLVDICPYKKGFLLFTDSQLNKIFSLDIESGKYDVLFDSLNLNQPTGIAYDSESETIWVVETASHAISAINKNGEIFRKIGKRGTKAGEFNFPTDIVIDKEKSIYVVDALNFRVQILDSLGNYISSFGKAGNATGYFARPKSIATDAFGNIYVTDALLNIIQIFNNEGELLHYFGSQGSEKNQFLMPAGIYIDKNNYIYIADSYNSRIQIYKTEKQ
jgi:DNA-binding beta-propeller fold protein YncE